MKSILPILFLIFSVPNLFGQNNSQLPKVTAKSFPTNINIENVKSIGDYDGKIVAYTAIIEKNEISRNKTPFYKLKIVDNDYLWTVLMFENKISKIGDTIRVVGYLRPIPTDLDKVEKKYLEGKYMVIAFGLVDFTNSNFLFLGGAEEQKKQWIDGFIPDAN